MDESAVYLAGKQTILVVDDQEAVRRVLRTMLGRCGFEVIEASSGGDALQVFAFHREHISAVLLDLMMPELSGADTFLGLRQLQTDLPIVVMSGTDEEDLPDFMRRRHAVGFLHKPCHMSGILASLDSVLQPGAKVSPEVERVAHAIPREDSGRMRRRTQVQEPPGSGRYEEVTRNE